MNKHPAYLGSVDDAFERVRSRVNNLIANLLPDAWEKFNSAFDLITSLESEKWSNAVHSCRRILEDLANLVFPPTKETRIFNGETKPSQLGKDQYINRIFAFLEDSKGSETFNEVISTNIDLFGNAIESLHSATNKGSHAVIKSQGEADRYVLNTYLIVGDVLLLWYLKNKPNNLIEGLSNTIFYESEKEAILNLYYHSKISPCKLIIKPDHPIGTKFIVIFRKNKLELEIAFDLRNFLMQMDDYEWAELEKGEYFQIGTHVFRKNKNPLLLIAKGDGLLRLETIFIEYIPCETDKQISEKNWKLVGHFSGQTRALIENNRVYFPYGTHGLSNEYRWIDQEFKQISDENYA